MTAVSRALTLLRVNVSARFIRLSRLLIEACKSLIFEGVFVGAALAALTVLAADFVGMLGFAVDFLAGLGAVMGALTVDLAVFFEAISDFLGAETVAKVFGLAKVLDVLANFGFRTALGGVLGAAFLTIVFAVFTFAVFAFCFGVDLLISPKPFKDNTAITAANEQTHVRTAQLWLTGR